MATPRMAMVTAAGDELGLHPSPEPRFRLSSPVRLRQEVFGGIAYHKGTGRLVEVDRGAFVVLASLAGSDAQRRPRGLRELAEVARRSLRRRVAASEVASLVRALAVRGIVEEVARPAEAGPELEQDFGLLAGSEDSPEDGYALSAPITVHWALTYRCGLGCAHCYSPPTGTPGELSRDEKLRVVERLAGWGVLEVAIGGGEPTACPDLGEVLQAVRGAGMIPSVTTNGQQVTLALAKMLAETCGCVQFSLDRPEILDAYRGPGVAARALAAARLLAEAGARVGANLLLVPENIGCIERSLEFLERQGLRRVVLLRPFDAGREWLPVGWPSEPDQATLRSSLREWTARRPAVSLEIACGLSCLLEDLTREERHSRLAFGCAGGRRFVALGADGTLWPCSHLSAPVHRLGHMLEDDPPTLWRQVPRVSGESKLALSALGLEELLCPASRLSRHHPSDTIPPDTQCLSSSRRCDA
ncbi:MAG: radical SAM protein [Chloroflexi bacterium]|nr:radical SAM protein [Chloroflexota bacterium]